MRILGMLVCYALSLMLPVNATVRHAAAAETAANGVFLVATRVIRDPNFKESVVLGPVNIYHMSATEAIWAQG